MKKVSIIIINWNGVNYLKDCLPSIAKQDYKNVELILIDNASSDNSVGYVKKHFPNTKIVINDKNYGFAEANNIGFKEVTGEYVLFLNNDTVVTKDFLSVLVKEINTDEKIGGIQSKILLMDKPDHYDSIGAYLTNTGILYHYGVSKKVAKNYEKKIDIFSAKGACMLFKKKVLDNILVNGELYDKRYFAYFEETDMCHRVWLAGYKIIYTPDSLIYHKMGGTSTRFNNSFVQYHSFKNRMSSYIKNLNMLHLIQIMPVHLVVCEVYACIYLFKGNIQMFMAVQKAIGWNVSQLSETLKRRKFINEKIRRVKDKEIFPFIYKKVKLSYYFYIFNLVNANVE